jgi:hypothetical protein
MGGQPPGPIGRTNNPIIDSGTLCRNESFPPGPLRDQSRAVREISLTARNIGKQTHTRPHSQHQTVMEVSLIARSIGKQTRTDPLSREGHAGLVFNLGQGGINDHWIAQAGPNAGFLVGNMRHCPSHGWHQEFSMAQGAIWDSPSESLLLPITVLMQICIASLTSTQLFSISNQLNQKRLRYVYETGPNSNTWVSMFLEQIGLSKATPPESGLVLKGWRWR